VIPAADTGDPASLILLAADFLGLSMGLGTFALKEGTILGCLHG
jgi:hypothetical protein